MERKKTGARELAVLVTAIAIAMTGWLVWIGDPGAIALVHTLLVSSFGFLTASFIKAGWEHHKMSELEMQLVPEGAPDPLPPKGFGE